ncbi:MAG: hypothetical protein CM1200mP10_05310 [Candidatus Neomarinimicrobiota bacterium]|nr:MAG: hypothetical protein CM1200mP10_05310 [Candidatus Neomarinimicrobiota bacterium]
MPESMANCTRLRIRLFPNKNQIHDIEVVVDRLVLKGDYKERLTESIELALKVGSGAISYTI